MIDDYTIHHIKKELNIRHYNWPPVHQSTGY